MIEQKKIFPDKIVKLIQKWEKCYPDNQKRSVIIPALHILQDMNKGYLTRDLMKKLAEYLSLPAMYVYEVANFYSMYNLSEVGKYQINICTNLSCMLNGSEKIFMFVKNKVNNNNSSKSGCKFTVKSVECQGMCCSAPVIEINKKFYEKVTINQLDKIINHL